SYWGGCASQAQWTPELGRGPRARPARDAIAAPVQLRPLPHCDQTDVARNANRLRDDKARAVIVDLDPNSSVDGFGRDHDPRRVSMLLDVVQRLGDVLQDDRLDGLRQVVGDPAVDVRLDSGSHPHRLAPLADP